MLNLNKITDGLTSLSIIFADFSSADSSSSQFGITPGRQRPRQCKVCHECHMPSTYIVFYNNCRACARKREAKNSTFLQGAFSVRAHRRELLSVMNKRLFRSSATRHRATAPSVYLPINSGRIKLCVRAREVLKKSGGGGRSRNKPQRATHSRMR